MPPFPKPRFDYVCDLARERAALQAHRRDKPGRQPAAEVHISDHRPLWAELHTM